MNLYLISQDQWTGYDTYDSAVVAAPSPEIAATIHPSGSNWWGGGPWCDSPESVDVEFIGVAKEGTAQGIICASFNAG